MLPLEASAHVPLIVMPPPGTAMHEMRGTTNDALVTLADLLPTFAGISNTTPPEVPLDGMDLCSLATGTQPPRERLFIQCQEHHGVVDGYWKYAFTDTSQEQLLFNLENDPEERTNLAGKPEFQAELERMHQILIEHLRASGHPSMKSGMFQPMPISAEGQERGVWPGHHSIHVPSDVLH